MFPSFGLLHVVTLLHKFSGPHVNDELGAIPEHEPTPAEVVFNDDFNFNSFFIY